NRRLAPAIYLDVVAICGTVDAPQIGGGGPVVEYALRMREFSQDALAARMLARDELGPAHIDALAVEVAEVHARIGRAAAGTRFGTPDSALRLAQQNFDQIGPLTEQSDDRALLDRIEAWTRREHAVRAPELGRRKSGGFIRECHGDLHLGN